MQFGGQTPLKLAEPLTEAGVPILGTSLDAIDLAEDRDRFKALVDKLGLKQPESGIAASPAEARAVAERIGYPIVIRPPMCWAAAPWRSCPTPARSSATSSACPPRSIGPRSSSSPTSARC